MKIRLISLNVYTKKTVELVDLDGDVTFIHGPIGKGKSTVARLIDYCFGGDLEWTPAIQREFLSTVLSVQLGENLCKIERSATDTQNVRISWAQLGEEHEEFSLNVPLDPELEPLITGQAVFNLSDLIFYLCGIEPIKVRKRTRDPNSPLIRLGFRDIWPYCYLEQTHLDSSFFRLEDPHRGRKSQDAMRFFTGLYSDRLSQIDNDLLVAIDEQRTKRETVQQIRAFMEKFELESETGLETQLLITQNELSAAKERQTILEESRTATIHPSDTLRSDLRRRGQIIDDIKGSIDDSSLSIEEQRSLHAELVTAKIKAERVEGAGRVLDDVEFQRCPVCGADIADRPHEIHTCYLCFTPKSDETNRSSVDMEVMRRDLNERIDQIADSILRRERELKRMQKKLSGEIEEKRRLDIQLEEEVARYDSAFIETIRGNEREIATLTERIRFLNRLQQMPKAINELEEAAGAMQGRIDGLRSALARERERLSFADQNIDAIKNEFKRIMLAVFFPGVSSEDEVELDPRNWKPTIAHHDIEWSFWDTGSGGKKTLFNVCYALALHSVAKEQGMPVPSILIIDGPTKNISEDENPELVRSLFDEIYRLAAEKTKGPLQFLIIDSDLIAPPLDLQGFSDRRMAGEPDSPSLISYYTGP
ncbi:MAG: DUF3732 domain-containing protein [Pyrinomonadaceae bacterium]